jgi:hypothetical protein
LAEPGEFVVAWFCPLLAVLAVVGLEGSSLDLLGTVEDVTRWSPSFRVLASNGTAALADRESRGC